MALSIHTAASAAMSMRRTAKVSGFHLAYSVMSAVTVSVPKFHFVV
jgi:hypothetical protein